VALALGIWIIARNVVIEPPARLTELINNLNAAIARLTRRTVPT
jgi:lipopolysaccharide export system permease protein